MKFSSIATYLVIVGIFQQYSAFANDATDDDFDFVLDSGSSSSEDVTEDVCGEEFQCVFRRRNITGFLISRELRDGTCQTRCAGTENARRNVQGGRSICGIECNEEPISIINECEDTDACPRARRPFQVNSLDDDGECVQKCTNARMGTRAIRRGGSCGPCPE